MFTQYNATTFQSCGKIVGNDVSASGDYELLTMGMMSISTWLLYRPAEEFQ